MDYIYAFRQANIDRLEDAGVKQYRNELVTRNNSQSLHRRIRRQLMAMLQVFVR